MSKSYPKVLITDETLRDGLQIEREGVTVEEKLELLNAMVDSGIKRMVVGAFVNPKWSPQMGDTLELVKQIKPVPGVSFFSLALNERGRQERAQYSPPLSVEPLPATHLHLCGVFIKRNTNRTLEDQEDTWQLPIDKALKSGHTEAAIGLSAGFGSNWSGHISHESRMQALRKQYGAWKAAGITVKRVDFADPMAWNTPTEIAKDVVTFVFKTLYFSPAFNARVMKSKSSGAKPFLSSFSPRNSAKISLFLKNPGMQALALYNKN